MKILIFYSTIDSTINNMYNNIINDGFKCMNITANELKTKGAILISKLMKKYEEIFITVRGQKKFVILLLEEYERLKEAELEMAIKEAEKDYKSGRYTVETAKEHFKKLKI